MRVTNIVRLFGIVTLLFAFSARSADDSCSMAYDNAADTVNVERCRAFALAGDSSAQFGYGLILWSGHNRAPNRAEALDWWRRAARQGNLLAQISLADLLVRKDLEPALRNEVEAYAWQSALGQVQRAGELWQTLSPEQQQRAKQLADQFKSKYVVPE